MGGSPFPRPPLESLPQASDRWTPVLLEHGRLHVDDSSVKWISADGLVCRLPVATLSAILLGPGTSITHAAVKACADSNTMLAWMGADGLHFYACSLNPTRSNENAKAHARAWANRNSRTAVARKMFQERFGEVAVTEGRSVQEMRGMEGIRVRALYAQLGERFGVTWKGRNYDKGNWEMADDINRAISTANSSLYAMTSAIVAGMGFLPQLGFIHETGDIPFVCDIADVYKHETSFPAAFEVLSQSPSIDTVEEQTRSLLKRRVEERRIFPRMVDLLSGLFSEKDKAEER